MARGECNCGAVAFDISVELEDVYICHCSICRRFTGSAGIAVVLVDNDDFRWTRGEEQRAAWRNPETGWPRWFCRICGSPVPGANDHSRMFVPVGLLTEGTERLRVAHHIWVSSKAGWDEIGDSGRQHSEDFRQ
jgi:hypothetical protein